LVCEKYWDRTRRARGTTRIIRRIMKQPKEITTIKDALHSVEGMGWEEYTHLCKYLDRLALNQLDKVPLEELYRRVDEMHAKINLHIKKKKKETNEDK